MVRPQELVESVLYTLQQDAELPNSTNFIGYTPDIESESIKLPLVEVSTGPMVELQVFNTDFIEFVTDSNGKDIGRRYETEYILELTVAAWTAHGSKYSPREISNVIRDSLYKHETRGPNESLRFPDGSPVDDVWRFSVEEGEQTDDLTFSPTLRRWQQTVSISAVEQYVTDTDEPPIDAINARLEQDEEIDGFETEFTAQ